MGVINLFFVHGFLGKPEDWDFIRNEISNKFSVKVFAVDCFADLGLTPDNNFSRWAVHFNEYVKKVAQEGDHNVLIGYSLGGRLALHSLELDPWLWKSSILISANPGFDDSYDENSKDCAEKFQSSERKARILQDSSWSEKFLNLEWNELLAEWNSQAVFNDSLNEPRRKESDFNRRFLALALNQWSLAKQKNFRPFLAGNFNKVQWMVGAKDTKFLHLSIKLKELIPELDLIVIPEASHRVMFDQPQGVFGEIQKFLKNLISAMD